jgi:hypothetical protein
MLEPMGEGSMFPICVDGEKTSRCAEPRCGVLWYSDIGVNSERASAVGVYGTGIVVYSGRPSPGLYGTAIGVNSCRPSPPLEAYETPRVNSGIPSAPLGAYCTLSAAGEKGISGAGWNGAPSCVRMLFGVYCSGGYAFGAGPGTRAPSSSGIPAAAR